MNFRCHNKIHLIGSLYQQKYVSTKKLQKQCTCWQCSKTWVTLNYFLPSTMAGSVAYCHWWWSGLRRDGGDMSRSRRRPPGGPLPSLAPVQVTMVTQWPPYTLTSCQTGLGYTGSNQDIDLKLHFYFDLKIWISHRMRFLRGNICWIDSCPVPGDQDPCSYINPGKV